MAPEYARPTTLAEAAALAATPGSVILAGGTDVLVWLKDGSCPIDRLVSLRDVAANTGLGGLRRERDGRWFVGAMTTHAWAAADPAMGATFPALADACRSVGSPAVRSSATIGGNVCTAAPSADSAGPLLAYRAEVVLFGQPERAVGTGRDRVQGDIGGPGERLLPLSEFFVGPGTTEMRPGDVMTGFRLPDPGPHGAAYRKLSRRRAMDIAIVSVCALVWLDTEGRATDLRIALGAVAPTPLAVDGAGYLARGRRCDARLTAELAAAAVAASRPVSDIRASAHYRREMVAALTRAAVLEAWRRAEAPAGTTATPSRDGTASPAGAAEAIAGSDPVGGGS